MQCRRTESSHMDLSNQWFEWTNNTLVVYFWILAIYLIGTTYKCQRYFSNHPVIPYIKFHLQIRAKHVTVFSIDVSIIMQMQQSQTSLFSLSCASLSSLIIMLTKCSLISGPDLNHQSGPQTKLSHMTGNFIAVYTDVKKSYM